MTPPAGRRILIAHRGASAYCPENTLPAYRLAIGMGADYVEQDLQITRDGVLVCLHDFTLERTTDVRAVFPARCRREFGRRRWRVSDFTLAEIRRLDAGSWFGEAFRGARIPAFQEAIDILRGRAGLFPETKAPEIYGRLGLDMEKLLLEALAANGLDRPGADPRTPVVIQSFSATSLMKLRGMGCRLPMLFLLSLRDARRWRSTEGLAAAREFAEAIGPPKIVLRADPGFSARARAAGLSVTAWTFGGDPAEMDLFFRKHGVDALFTDNPDRFPR